jgi:hypothetical protein
MLFGNRAAEQYPNLQAYLRETERIDLWQDLRTREIITYIFAAAAPVALGFILSKVSDFTLPWIVTGGLFLASFYAAFAYNTKQRQAYSTPEFESRLVAHRVLSGLRKMNQLHRLHRDLSESTLTVLDEVARTRQEIRNIMEMPYWKQPDLGESYKQLREQSLVAADQAILDAVLQFRAAMPEQVQARKMGDFVDEAFETYLKLHRKPVKFAEAGFDAAYKIAGKLQEMRNALEEMTNQASNDIFRAPTQIPGGLVDMAMMEIRTLRQAEEELQQDQRG